MNVDPFLGPFCAFMSSVTWAIGSASYSKLSFRYTAFSVNFARALVALPLFFVATFVVTGGWKAGWDAYSALGLSHLGWFSLSMIASYGLGDVLFLWSTRSLGVPGALAIASSYPLWTALSGVVFQGEMILSQAIGLILTVAGIVMVILNAPAVQREVPAASAKSQASALPKWLNPSRATGVLLAFATSLLWAVNTFAVSRGGADLLAPVGNTVRMAIALAMSAGLSLLLAPRAPILMPAWQIRASLWVFCFEAFGGSYFFLYGLSNSTLVIGATLASLAPVLAVPVAWVLRLERVSWKRTLGVGLVVLGLWLLMTQGNVTLS